MANRPAVRPGSSRVRRRVEWIAAHSPRTKGRIERLFGTVQDRLVREMRIQQIASLEQGNRFLELTFWPLLALRFTRQSTTAVNAHRPLERTQHLEGILSVRQTRTVAADNTVSWQDQRWGLWREDVCAGLRGARVEIGCGSATSANRPDTVRYLPLHACPAAPPSALLAAYGLEESPMPKSKHPHRSKPIASAPDHPWRKPWERTFLSGRKPDISTLR